MVVFVVQCSNMGEFLKAILNPRTCVPREFCPMIRCDLVSMGRHEPEGSGSGKLTHF